MTTKRTTTRPPVIVVMGHIDHGKSTLLDYIRKSNTTAKEAGGITQRMSAYKVIKKDTDGKERSLTFLDTPGHEAFKELRSRGARVADIAILVVATDEGVKPQTIEALTSIKNAGLPYIIAMNKIDRPGANIEKLKMDLAENEIFVEGYGGDIPALPVSAINGKGVSELLDMIILLSDIQELKADKDQKGEGIIIEAENDKTKGISATVILKNGSIRQGEFMVCEDTLAPLRLIEDFENKRIKEAFPSDPVRITGWNSMPPLGGIAICCSSKKECEKIIKNVKREFKEKKNLNTIIGGENALLTIPIIIKASTTDVLEAIIHEIKKISCERVCLKIINASVGFIGESDVKLATGAEGGLILGFDTKIDNSAKALAERDNIKIKIFNIIYKLTEWLDEYVKENTPKVKTEEIRGVAKVLKFFSKVKDRQVIGAKVENGSLKVGDEVRIRRREEIIGKGKIKELQQSKNKTEEVSANLEFGGLIESKMEIAPGDKLESITIIEK